MRLLVTGGAGFIGSHVAHGALERGLEVAVLDDLSTGRRENVPRGAKLYEVDLRDREAATRVLQEFRPDVVSHQAAQASVSRSMQDPRFDVEVNVMGGLNLLEACTQSGVAVERLVFASTGGAIYGEVAEGSRATESTPPSPKSPYAMSKLCFEQLLGVYESQRGMKSTVLRYANVYGPRQDPHGEAGVVAIFCAAVFATQSIAINARKASGDDGCVRDYVYVADVAAANLLAVRGALAGRVLNVGTGVGITTRELATEIFRAARREVPIRFSPPRAGDLERSVLDPSATERALGAPLTSLAQGLEHTLTWYEASV
jgi:UDP-glucose 4-epimerase